MLVSGKLVIASGATETNVSRLGSRSLVGIGFPAGYDGGDVTLVAVIDGVDYTVDYAGGGVSVIAPSGAGSLVPVEIAMSFPVDAFKLRSALAVAADRVIAIVTEDF